MATRPRKPTRSARRGPGLTSSSYSDTDDIIGKVIASGSENNGTPADAPAGDRTEPAGDTAEHAEEPTDAPAGGTHPDEPADAPQGGAQGRAAADPGDRQPAGATARPTALPDLSAYDRPAELDPDVEDRWRRVLSVDARSARRGHDEALRRHQRWVRTVADARNAGVPEDLITSEAAAARWPVPPDDGE